jgi:hypothetical protein
VDLLRIGPASMVAAPREHGVIIKAGFGLRDNIAIIHMQEIAEIFVETSSEIRVVFLRKFTSLLHANLFEHARQIENIAYRIVGTAGESFGHEQHLARQRMRSPSPEDAETRIMAGA